MNISKTHILFPGIIVIVSLLTINSCLDDRYDFNRISDEIEILPGLAAPVAFGSLSIADILMEVDKDNDVREFDDNLLYVCYSDKLVSFRASEIIDIPDQTFLEIYLDSEFSFPFGFPPGLTIELSKQKKGEFIFYNNERIDSIFPKQTSLLIEVNSSFKHSGSLTISSPNVFISGDTLSEIITIADISGNFVHTNMISLDGSKIILDNSIPGTTILPLNFNLEMVSSGAPVSEGDKCDITISFVNLDFYSIHGYVGDYEVLFDAGGVEVQLFAEQIAGGNLFFFDPRIHLEINNSYGVPVSVQLLDVMAKSKINDVTTPVVFEVDTFMINAPEIIGSSAFTEIVIDRSICNIPEVLETQPNEFFFKAKAITNPGGSSTSSNNFVTDSSNVDVDFMVIMPIWLRAEGFSLNDTVEFNLEEEFGELLDFLRYLRVTLNITNGLPMKADIQVYFTDEFYIVIDSMFHADRAFLEPAVIDGEDKVSERITLENRIEFTEERLEAIKGTKHAIVKADIETARAEEKRFVKFLSDYVIDFDLKIKADFTINTRDL